MTAVYRWIISLLVWLSADPAAIDLEAGRAAAAVAAARASLAHDVAPAPTPSPAECVCGGTCRNGVWKPDGRVEQRCPCPTSCPCKSKPSQPPATCPDGKCPTKVLR